MLDIDLNDKNRRILATVPERWGRMDPLSRAALLAVGRLLREAGLLDSENRVPAGRRIGLIAGTRHGCLTTDLEYAGTLAMGAQFAGPALFGYTLPNIPLAETAVHYKLTGPVFSLYASEPFAEAVATAREWLDDDRARCEIIIAGELDMRPGDDTNRISAHFTICHA